jgi:hypothetical protein
MKTKEEKLEDPDDQLFYHYTSQRGLLGIMKEKKIWATNIRYLNDESEFDYGVNKVLEVLESGPPQIRRDLSDTVRGHLKRGDLVSVFVVSFSSDSGDKLSQWRGYCTEGTGFSLGFEPKKLRMLAEKQNFVFEPCVYKEIDQAAKIRSIIPSADEEFNSLDASYFRKIGKERLDFLFKVFSLAPLLKHPKFKEEEEWRLISNDQAICKRRLRFREGNSMIVPYFEFDLTRCNITIPIKEIVIGPNPHRVLARNALEELLSANDIDPHAVALRDSGIPYRYW